MIISSSIVGTQTQTMRSLPIGVVLLLVLLLTSGEGAMKANGKTCETRLHGGGCDEAKCDEECKRVYGSEAFGICISYEQPINTCFCRYPCN